MSSLADRPAALTSQDPRTGFTLLEVVLAAFLLTAGVGALLGTGMRTVRMVVRGRQATRAMQAASTQLEVLRGVAETAPTYCAGLSDGADSSPDGTAWQWRIGSTGSVRNASVAVSLPVLGGGRATDSLTTAFWCP